MKFFKENITKEQRQLAKAVNFGLPGGMATKRLYRHLRESGIKTTMEEADKLRTAWLETFTEMNKHFSRKPIGINEKARYGMKSAEDDEEEDDYEEDPLADKKRGKDLYLTTTITGFIRNRATFNATCNTDFQNPVAHVAKEALWNLEAVGLGNRMLNFVHDEVDYWLYPEEVKQIVPIVEKLWLEPGKRIFPHVKLKCETTLSLYWDKHGIEFPDLEWNDDGTPKLELPDFVKQAHEQFNGTELIKKERNSSV